MSIDREELSKVLAGGQAMWAVPGAMPGTFSEAETRQLVRQDLEGARRLMAEAGYPNGIDLEWPFPRDDTNLTMFQLVQSQ